MPPQNENYQSEEQSRHTEASTRPWVVPLSIVLAGALIGAGIYLSNSSPKKLANTALGPSVIDTINIAPITTGDHIRGNPNAEVFIVEFSDTECPFCKQFHQTMQRIMNEYGADGKVAWVYRHLPIDSLHTRARKEAEATECAAELGGNNKFWEYIDLVFSRTQSNDTLDPAELPKIAKDIGLDQKKFEECLASGRHTAKVREHEIDAASAGARGTPHSIVVTARGEKVSLIGAQPYDLVKAVIDTALTD